MNSLKFIMQYILKPHTVGAILPSSRFLARKMVSFVEFDRCKTIVEYGPGTGVFTDEMLRLRNPGTKLILIEKNTGFADALKKKYANTENMAIINDSAENIGKLLNEHSMNHADCILSGLPFASLPTAVSESILVQTKTYLAHGGRFVTFQYTLLKKEFITKHFEETVIVRELRNIPPAYVLCCKKL